MKKPRNRIGPGGAEKVFKFRMMVNAEEIAKGTQGGWVTKYFFTLLAGVRSSGQRLEIN